MRVILLVDRVIARMRMALTVATLNFTEAGRLPRGFSRES